MTVTVLQGSHEVDLTMTDGETYRASVDYVEEDGVTPINLLGADAQLHLKHREEDEAPVITLTVGDGLTILGSAGRINIAIPASITDEKVGTYVFDLRLVFSNGDVAYLFGGAARITRARTNLSA